MCSQLTDTVWAKWCCLRTRLSRKVTMWHLSQDGRSTVWFQEAVGWKSLIPLNRCHFLITWAVLVCHLISSIAEKSIATDISDTVPVCESNDYQLFAFNREKKEKKPRVCNWCPMRRCLLCELIRFAMGCRNAWLHSLRGTVRDLEAKARRDNLCLCSFRSCGSIGGSTGKASRSLCGRECRLSTEGAAQLTSLDFSLHTWFALNVWKLWLLHCPCARESLCSPYCIFGWVLDRLICWRKNWDTMQHSTTNRRQTTMLLLRSMSALKCWDHLFVALVKVG